MSKEKSIILSTEEVRSVLDGRKTMARRVIKPQPDHCHRDIIGKEKPYNVDDWNKLIPQVGEMEIKPPHQVGDILWVRETWCMVTALNDCEGKHSNQCGGIDSWDYYKADGKTLPSDFKWNPSIHMPRAAARLFLKVKDIRVERLQEISIGEICKEGIETDCRDCIDHYGECGEENDEDDECGLHDDTFSNFESLWNSINAKRGYGWDSNPWVWVISFERIENA